MALAYFGESEKMQEILHGAAGLDCRSFVVTKAAELLPPEPFVRDLRAAQSPAEQKELLNVLGGYLKNRFSAGDQAYLSGRLSTLAATAGNSAVKSAASWCLSQWQIPVAEADPASSQKVAAGRNWFVNSVGQTLIVIPAGENFLMGSPEWETGHEDSERRHWARIDRSFAIAATETTQGQFREFLLDERIKRLFASERHQPTFSPDPQDARPQPASWRDAARFCQWLSEHEGLPESEWCYPGIFTATDSLVLPADYLGRTGYRLPREMEWEYIARAGSGDIRHCGSDEEVLTGYEWCMPQSRGRVHSVAALRPNDLGFFDTLGNAVEWCDDLYAPYKHPLDSFIRTDGRGNTKFPRDADKCVARGASVNSQADKLRVANRSYELIGYHNRTTGFRVARTVRQ